MGPGLSLAPTIGAPGWYQPGATHFCQQPDSSPPIIEPMTAYCVYYESPPGYPKYRTTPDNADYSANCGRPVVGHARWN